MTNESTSTIKRLNRFRSTPALRALAQETRLSVSDFIQPIFVSEDPQQAGPIAALPGVRRYALSELHQIIGETVKANIRGILLFGLPTSKDHRGSSAYDINGVVPKAILRIKELAPQLAIFTDVCLCQYTDHGHCHAIGQRGPNLEQTLDAIAQTAVAHARAGADVVAPSGMIDGGIAAIRQVLDSSGFGTVGILSYAVKYASALYGPFREAVHSAPLSGDRKSHQLHPANIEEGLREAHQDVLEGADALMVKPAGMYLDVIARIKREIPGLPLAAYQVSGEYAAIVAAGERGWIDQRAVALESLLAIKRAGAGMIISYFANQAAGWLAEEGGQS